MHTNSMNIPLLTYKITQLQLNNCINCIIGSTEYK